MRRRLKGGGWGDSGSGGVEGGGRVFALSPAAHPDITNHECSGPCLLCTVGPTVKK